jgi:hypothetical protein
MPMASVRMSSSPSMAMRASAAEISGQRLQLAPACSTSDFSYPWINQLPGRVP